MRNLKVTLLFLAMCCVVFVVASVVVVTIAGWLGVANWLGDVADDTVHFNSTATLTLGVFALVSAFLIARRYWQQSRMDNSGEGVAMRALALVANDERQVAFRVSREDRWWGMVFLGGGLLVCVLPVIAALAGIDDAFPQGPAVGITGGLILGGLFLAIGCRIGLRSDEIRFDLSTRRYTCRLGFPWSIRRWEGSLDEISRLEMIGEPEELDEVKFTVWRVCLIWHDETRQPIVLAEYTRRLLTMGQDRRRLASDAMLDLARKLDVQAHDERSTRVSST